MEFLDNFGFEAAQIQTLQTIGRFAEAAELTLKEGNVIGAIDLFLEANDPASHKRVVSCVLDRLWRCHPLGAPKTSLSDTDQLLRRIKRLHAQSVDPLQKLEVCGVVDSSPALQG